MPSRHRSVFACLACWSVLSGMQAQQPVPSATAQDDVRALLASPGGTNLDFPLHERCDQLLAKQTATRQRAGEFLLALVMQVAAAAKSHIADEDYSKRYDRQHRARQLQLDLARTLGNLPLGGDGAEAAPVALWLWQHADDGEMRGIAAHGLTSILTPEVDQFFLSLVHDGCTVPWASYYALDRIEARKLPVDKDALLRLCQSYDEGLRERAADLVEILLGMPRPDFVPERSFGSQLEQTLTFVAELVPEAIPADAPWVDLTIPPQPQFGWNKPGVVPGWLLQAGGDGKPWRLMTSFGVVRTFDFAGITTHAGSLAAFAAHLIAERERYDQSDDNDVKREIETEQGLQRFSFSSGDTWHGSAAELLVSSWLFGRGDRQHAAALLLPQLAKAWDAHDYLDPLLDEIAANLDVAMLDAFALDRDYDKAVALARLLASPELASFAHQDRARDLLEQLPKRSTDFHDLRLPTPTQWKELQQTLPRAKQIDYLVARLRLLSCQQMSNPGGLGYDQDQYGLPPSSHPPQSTGFMLIPSQRELADLRINPYTELLLLDLTGGELTALLPALESRDYVLAFDVERFLPQRPQNLHRVAWVAATICNEVAQAAIVDARPWLGNDAERAQARQEFTRFCAQHANQHTSDRLAARMLEVDDWQEIRRTFWNLNTTNPVRAAATMLDVGKRHPEQMPDIVRLIALLDRGELVGDARDWLRADDTEERFFAAVLLLRHRQDTTDVFPIVQQRLTGPGGGELVPGAVEALLACDLPAAKDLLLALLAGKHASGYQPSPAFAQRLLLAGLEPAFTALDEALSGRLQLATPFVSGAEQVHEQTVRVVSTWWPDLPAALPYAPAPAAVESLASALRERLAADWARIVAQQRPAMQPASLELPWGDLQSYSTGWIRRM